MEIIRSSLLGELVQGPVEVVITPEEGHLVLQAMRVAFKSSGKRRPVAHALVSMLSANLSNDDGQGVVRVRAERASSLVLPFYAQNIQEGAISARLPLVITERVMTTHQFERHKQAHPNAIIL